MKIDVAAAVRRIYAKGRNILVDEPRTSPDTWYGVGVNCLINFCVVLLMYMFANQLGEGRTALWTTSVVSVLVGCFGGIMLCLPTKKPHIRRIHILMAVSLIAYAISFLLGLIAAYLIF